ncbi:YTH1 [[Candida] subhashii]|uniref:mRNA 3'-end-processing protein n=1 Tax=[Candida] subhashii TaxID=561895 RepID=A0A8J5V0K0_9ASCO|nr:YTH1 [[Candida] subhashii]KAG7663919.1 YTH1 [[Candida] subhashii]
MYSNKIVCKHWLRGLCKKNDHCEFLHEYNLRKMPECLFYSKNGFCTQTPECLYLHVDPQSKIPECQNYNKGFCPDGPNCKNRHVRRVLCPLFLAGFCPKGPECEYSHPKFEGIVGRLRVKPNTVKLIDNKDIKDTSEEAEGQNDKEEESKEADGTIQSKQIEVLDDNYTPELEELPLME